MTDCGGLLNRRSPGRKRCCHTEALHAGYQVYSSHGLFLSRIIELSNFSSHGMSRMVTVLLSRDLSFGPTDQREVICELSIFSSHGESRRSRFYCHELSNYRISFHTESLGIYVTNYRIVEFLFTRRVTEVFFVTRHVLCHEFANWFLHADCRGGYEGGTIEA